ncbi:MAG: peroxiredoxin [Lautropia sp.]
MSSAIPAVGRKAPGYQAESTGGTVSPQDHAGRIVVLYFYPKDNTPGCTTEGKDFAERHAAFEAAGATIYGVSRDSLKSHANFKAKMGFPFELISDPDEALCTRFDVMKMKNMYGKQVRGVERSTFVIGRDGKLVREWRGVKVPGHAQEVLDFVGTL